MGKLKLKVARAYRNIISADSDEIEVKKDGNIFIVKDTVKVGRSDKLDIRFIHGMRRISRKHMAFVEHLGNWFVKDLGSKNGTYLVRDEGIVKQIEGRFEIEKGDKICLASQDTVTFVVLDV